MEIKYFGHSSFFLKGKTTSLITDPFDTNMVGLKYAKHVTSDIITVSHDHADHNMIHAVEGNPFVVKGPGEYEIKGVHVIGIPSYHDTSNGSERGMNTIYRIEIDGITCVHLGDLGHMLTKEDIETLDGVDILFVPIGGQYTIGIQEAENIISEIEPSIVIPMHYNRPGLNQEQFSKLVSVEEFLKAMGKETIAAEPKLTVTKDKIPTEMQVVVLQ